MLQNILIANENYNEVDLYLKKLSVKKIMLVCGNSLKLLRINSYFENLIKNTDVEIIYFSDFHPNPVYESVVNGVTQFKKNKCDMVISAGGGSAIDVAKCIKLYSNMDLNTNFLEQDIITNNIPFLVIPTTAGSGSEATKYAVIYLNGEKLSIEHESCIPSHVLIDSSVLDSLPIYQKKSTMMDAFCHAIESFWSINSNDESRNYSKEAIEIIVSNKDDYLSKNNKTNINMLKASNIAGRAINITQTTAAHAMSYKLTSMYGISHGQAVSICLSKLFLFMLKGNNSCIDIRGESYIENIYKEIATSMGFKTPLEAALYFEQTVNDLGFSEPLSKDKSDINILKKSVNLTRLKNHPIQLNETDIENLYREIVL